MPQEPPQPLEVRLELEVSRVDLDLAPAAVPAAGGEMGVLAADLELGPAQPRGEARAGEERDSKVVRWGWDDEGEEGADEGRGGECGLQTWVGVGSLSAGGRSVCHSRCDSLAARRRGWIDRSD